MLLFRGLDTVLPQNAFILFFMNGTNGEFSGQYIVCDLESFANKNLHHRIGAGHFKLELHRTDVVRDPVGADVPIFPLRAKYYQANYTLEGVEKKLHQEDGGGL